MNSKFMAEHDEQQPSYARSLFGILTLLSVYVAFRTFIWGRQKFTEMWNHLEHETRGTKTSNSGKQSLDYFTSKSKRMKK